MRRRRRFTAVLAAVLALPGVLAACARSGLSPAGRLESFGLAAEPRPGALDVCRSYGCADTAHVSLSDAEWARVRALFAPPPADARDERSRAARAVGLMEELVGPKAGTEHAMPRNEPGPPGTAQLDCVADAFNTTVYLLLLERDGLLPRHRVGHPAHRGFLLFFPHNTAVLVERDTGASWAVDAWSEPYGAPPAVWPLEVWRAWKEKAENRENRPSDGSGITPSGERR